MRSEAIPSVQNHRCCEEQRDEAIYGEGKGRRLLRRYASRNDGAEELVLYGLQLLELL